MQDFFSPEEVLRTTRERRQSAHSEIENNEYVMRYDFGLLQAIYLFQKR